MPKKIIDYSKSVIFRIVCRDINITECYVGSTTNLIKRRAGHKTVCHNINSKGHHLKVYKYIRANNGWDNFSAVLVETFPCDNNEELLKRERYWIEHYKASLNGQLPCRTITEYRQDNKQKMAIKGKQYYDDNKYQKKQYYLNNKEQIEKKKKQIIECECGKTIQHMAKARHEKTKYHKTFINK